MMIFIASNKDIVFIDNKLEAESKLIPSKNLNFLVIVSTKNGIFRSVEACQNSLPTKFTGFCAPEILMKWSNLLF